LSNGKNSKNFLHTKNYQDWEEFFIMVDLKQAIVLRTDIKMSRGKQCAQSAHASLDACLKVMQADRVFKAKNFNLWKQEGMKKVVLKVDSKEELIQLRDKATQSGIQNALIKDAGFTELEPGTITAVGIGPDKEDKIDKITGHLSAL
jgi:PTH2 family peptidyl-tRNA hydrolase